MPTWPRWTRRVAPRPRTVVVAVTAIAAVAAIGAAAVALASRAGEEGGDTETFCAGVAENLDALRAEPASPDDVEVLIDVWRDVGEDAPLAIEPDWDAYVTNLESAWTGEDAEEIYTRIYASERAAVNIAGWLDDTCGLDWGPVTTIVPDSVAEPSTSSTTTTAPA
jgi:hypothetical protein